MLASETEFVMAMTAVKGTSTETMIQSSACRKENELSVTRRKVLYIFSMKISSRQSVATYTLARTNETASAYNTQDWIARAVLKSISSRADSKQQTSVVQTLRKFQIDEEPKGIKERGPMHMK